MMRNNFNILIVLFILNAPNFVLGQNNFIKVDKKSGYLFERNFPDRTWIPIELNCMLRDSINSDSIKVFKKYELLFKNFSSHGGNSIRLWMGREGYFDPTRYVDSLSNTGILHFKRLLDLAKTYNIRVKVCLEVARNFSGKGAFHKDKLAIDEGGLLIRFKDYIDTEIGRNLYLEKVRYFSKFFQDNDTIYCWELWNEINTVSEGDWRAFSIYMLKRVKSFFPNHLVSVSLGSLDSQGQLNCYKSYLTFNDRDISFVHRYYDLGAEMQICKSDPYVFLYDAVQTIKLLQKTSKPIFVNETGAVMPRHAGDSPLYKIDTSGVLLHDMIFVPFFSGTIGPGSMWHYWSYIQPNKLWYHYERFKEVFDGINVKKERFSSVKVEMGDLSCLGLVGKKHIVLWFKNKSSNIHTELLKDSSVHIVSPVDISIKTLLTDKKVKPLVKIFNPWERKWTETKIDTSQVVHLPEFNRTILLILEVF